MSKREASNTLTHDNWEDEEEVEEAGEFKKASSEVIGRREIKKPRRRLAGGDDGPASEASKPKESVFKGFSFGVVKPGTVAETSKLFSLASSNAKPFGSTPTESSFSFTASVPSSNSIVNPAGHQSTTLSSGTVGGVVGKSPETGAAESMSTGDTGSDARSRNNSNGVDEKSAKKATESRYKSSLRSLNEGVVSWITTHVNRNPYCILSPIFVDYEKYLTQLENARTSSVTTESSADAQESQMEGVASANGSATQLSTTAGLKTTEPSLDAVPSSTSLPAQTASSPLKTSPANTHVSPLKFGSVPATTASPLAPTSCTAPVFGLASSTTPAFGTPSSNALPLFGTATSTVPPKFDTSTCNAPAPFGSAPKSSAPVFGAPTAPASGASEIVFGGAPASKPFSFGATSSGTSLFGTQPSSSSAAATFTFGIGASNAAATSSLFAPMASSAAGLSSVVATTTAAATSVFTAGFFGASTAGVQPFSFSAKLPAFGQPSSIVLGGDATKKEGGEDGEGASNEAEDGEYVPPKPESVEIKEEGSFYTVRCKLFYNLAGAWADRGVGNLYLKKTADNKTQLLIRTDTALGNILLNVLLYKNMAVKMMNATNVSIACVPNPPVVGGDLKPISMLLKVKQADDAAELCKQLQDNRPQ